MPVIPVALMAAIVKKVVGFIKYVSVKDWAAVKTQILAWLAGIGAALAGAHSVWAGDLAVLGHRLHTLSVVDQGIVGFAVASGASYFLHDVLAGIDNQDTASEPVLGA